MEADFAAESKQRLDDRNNRTIRVPMPTFPPTAMVYTLNSEAENDAKHTTCQTQIKSVPTSLIAQVLCPPESTRKPSRFYICSGCNKELRVREMSTQTLQTACLDNSAYLKAAVVCMKATGTAESQLNQPGVHTHTKTPKSRLNSFSSDISRS